LACVRTVVRGGVGRRVVLRRLLGIEGGRLDEDGLRKPITRRAHGRLHRGRVRPSLSVLVGERPINNLRHLVVGSWEDVAKLRGM
jgi:hypothetical protein